ncbi:MAG: tetratricopeptide repeat protein [Rhodospirillales bacterium]|jgi:tetratricopeptide (TPR) repeat protein|nr:tetratricopeptide repeat protein [Rhodospirillales bacterium]
MASGAVGCAVVSEGDVFDGAFWAGTPFAESRSEEETRLGLAEMTQGNYGRAESHFNLALKLNPQNVHALLGRGVLYQNTGQVLKAREMYEAILAIRPEKSKQMVVWTNFAPKPISDIASVNLALLESGGVPASMEQGAAGRQEPSQAGSAISSAPSASALTARTPPPPASAPVSAVKPGPAMTKFADADANVVSRFKTLIALRDQGLITQEEYRTRRQANIGALVPLISPPPAAGLDRPFPTTEQVAGRLRAIGRALEMRAMTISQHASERSMILDALVPSAPVVVANPGVPPRGLMEAADAVRRLERLRTDHLINSDEYTKERAAIEGAMQPKPPPRPKMVAAAKAGGAPTKMEAKNAGPQPAVHLASYRTKKAANRGWAQLRRAHRKLLGKLKSEITKVNLGPGKGVYYRLKVGPVDSAAAANNLCRKLKKRRQYCEPSFIGTS